MKKIIFYLKVILSIAFMFLATKSIGDSWSKLENINLTWVALSFVLIMLSAVLGTARWWLINMGIKLELPFVDYLTASFVGIYYNQILPTSFGGDFVKYSILSKYLPKKKVAYGIFLDRISTLIVLAAHLFIVYVILRYNLIDPALVALFIIVMFLTFLYTFFKQHRVRIIIGMLAISVSYASLLLLLASFYLICISIGGVKPNLQLIFVDFPVSLLLSAIPASIGGWGVREWYLSISDPNSDGLIVFVSILYGLLNVFTALPGFLIEVRKGFKYEN